MAKDLQGLLNDVYDEENNALRVSTSGAYDRALKSGRYYSSAGVLSTRTLSQGIPYASPLFVPVAATVDRIGLGITAAGDVGSVVRLGIYADNDGLPGTLVLDAGTIPGDAVAVAEITISQALSAGRYWLVGVGQGITTTPPTARGLAGFSSDVVGSESASIHGGNNIPGLVGFTVAGALPASFGTANGAASVAKIVVRVA